MRILLAPMEGVVDYWVRDLLTGIGGIDQCVTEFVRVTQQRLPRRVFLRLAPEIAHGNCTAAGVPVKLQLLGGNAPAMAENARRAVRAGANAIDINFGCPAKTVNKSDGGACLLRTPERLYQIVSAVREALPDNVSVSAKIRLGYEEREGYLDTARAIDNAGANELVVHARSKADGYRPPAYWDAIAEIAATVSMPVVANGEVWSLKDYRHCRQRSGCTDVMLGRGLLARPDLGKIIHAHQRGEEYTPMAWPEILALLHHYYHTSLTTYPQKYAGNRIKQWLVYLQRNYAEAKLFFEQIKREREPERLEQAFTEQRHHFQAVS